jgi:hypothetical protein
MANLLAQLDGIQKPRIRENLLNDAAKDVGVIKRNGNQVLCWDDENDGARIANIKGFSMQIPDSGTFTNKEDDEETMNAANKGPKEFAQQLMSVPVKSPAFSGRRHLWVFIARVYPDTPYVINKTTHDHIVRYWRSAHYSTASCHRHAKPSYCVITGGGWGRSAIQTSTWSLPESLTTSCRSR